MPPPKRPRMAPPAGPPEPPKKPKVTPAPGGMTATAGQATPPAAPGSTTAAGAGRPTAQVGRAEPMPQAPQPQGALSGPGAAEQYWQGVQGKFAGHNPTPNYAADAYNRSLMRPTEAGLDPYYKKAHEIGAERIDRAMGARGMFASSAANEAQTDLAARLGAEQANREADFMLAQQGENRMGATAATQGGIGVGNQELGWLMGGGQLAGAAQGAERIRWNDQAYNLLQGIMGAMPMVSQGFEQILMQDQHLLDLINQGNLAQAKTYAEQKKNQWDRMMGGGGFGIEIGGAIGGGRGGGGES